MIRKTMMALPVAGLLACHPAAAQTPDPAELTVIEAAGAIRSGSLTSRALVDALIAQAEAGAALNAFITLDADGARAAADAADAAVAAGGDLGPLHGVPLVLKDNILVAGLPATGGTPGLEAFVPAESAPVAQALLDAGAIVLGKTNMHELAFGITSNNGRFGAVGNAYDPDRIAGGSSGGTGAAVGARMAPGGLGTDTGGSVRIPAALNGVAGLRPTVGRYSGEGIVPISTTRDTAGPIARTIADVALLDAVLAGEENNLEAASLEGVRFGLATPFVDDLSPETAKAFDAALEKLREAGATFVELDLAPVMALNDKVGFPVALFEARRDIAAFLKDHDTGTDLESVASATASPDVNGLFADAIVGPNAVPEAVYREAMDVHRPALQAAYAEAFADHDIVALLFPATPLEAAPKQGSDQTVDLNGRQVPTFFTYIRNTDPGSNAGIPGLVVPMGLTADGLPVGLELEGPAGSDRDLLALGAAMEALLGRLPAP